MSKASDWANRKDRPRYRSIAEVSDGGDLYLTFGRNEKYKLFASEALDLARWILDTFGEPHVCTLPDSIKEALNSGDGTYRP